MSKAGKREEAEAINVSLMLLHQRLFLESNPIPAKKVAWHLHPSSLHLLRGSVYLLHLLTYLPLFLLSYAQVLQLMGRIDTGIRPPLCGLADEHLDKLREAMIMGKLV